jgi:hypothetical protein
MEAMLRWLVEEKREEIRKTIEALPTDGEVFHLPTPQDGLPEQWAYGDKTGGQISLAGALSGLGYAKQHLANVDRAIEAGDFPLAIYLIDLAAKSIRSACASWYSSSATRMWNFVEKRRNTKKRSARVLRKDVTLSEITEFRESFTTRHGREWGWKKAAALQFDVDMKTINGRLRNVRS